MSLAEEIAAEMSIDVEKVRHIQKISQEVLSIETPIGDEEDSTLSDFIPDERNATPSQRWPLAWRWAAFAAGAVVACCVTPYGWQSLLAAGDPQRPVIDERIAASVYKQGEARKAAGDDAVVMPGQGGRRFGVVRQEGEEGVELVGGAGQLEDEVLGGRVDHARAECLRQPQRFNPRLSRASHLDHRQLALD